MYSVTDDPLPFLQGLYQLIPENRIAAISDRTDRQSRRNRRLPARSVAGPLWPWGCLLNCLFPKSGDVCIPARRSQNLSNPPLPRPASGWALLRSDMYSSSPAHLATHQTVGAFYRGWRLMGLDSTVLDLPDTPANERVFAARLGTRSVGLPPSTYLALCELGTHAICGD